MKKSIVLIYVLLTVGIFTVFSSCNSNGTNSNHSEDFYEVTIQQTLVCPNCNGYGVYGGYTCIACNGSGQIQFEEVESRSYGNVNFRGRVYTYGPCNSGCGCKKYVHAPGQTQCVSCAYYNCTSNKFGHKKIYE